MVSERRFTVNFAKGISVRRTRHDDSEIELRALKVGTAADPEKRAKTRTERRENASIETS